MCYLITVFTDACVGRSVIVYIGTQTEINVLLNGGRRFLSPSDGFSAAYFTQTSVRVGR